MKKNEYITFLALGYLELKKGITNPDEATINNTENMILKLSLSTIIKLNKEIIGKDILNEK